MMVLRMTNMRMTMIRMRMGGFIEVASGLCRVIDRILRILLDENFMTEADGRTAIDPTIDFHGENRSMLESSDKVVLMNIS
jgi:hypothetical protein